MPRYKLGRLASVRPVGLHDLATYARDPFPAPPAIFDAPTNVDWGMDGNDSLGDCTIAGVDHLLATWNYLFGESDPRPSLETLENEYRALSPDDQGCVESTVLRTWQTTGLFGNTIAAYAPINHRSVVELKQGVAFLGALYLGIACPDSAQEQFGQQEQIGQMVPWTVVPGAQIVGGHCIVAVGYTADGLLCVTWGAVVEVTWAWLHKYLEESWAIISHELVEHGSDTLGLDVLALTRDLGALKVA